MGCTSLVLSANPFANLAHGRVHGFSPSWCRFQVTVGGGATKGDLQIWSVSGQGLAPSLTHAKLETIRLEMTGLSNPIIRLYSEL